MLIADPELMCLFMLDQNINSRLKTYGAYNRRYERPLIHEGSGN